MDLTGEEENQDEEVLQQEMYHATQANPVLQAITPEVIKLLVQAFQDAQNARRTSAAAASSMDTAAIPIQDSATESGGKDASKGSKGKAAAAAAAAKAKAGASVQAVAKSHPLPPPALKDKEQREQRRGRSEEKENKEREDGRSRSPKEDKAEKSRGFP